MLDDDQLMRIFLGSDDFNAGFKDEHGRVRFWSSKNRGILDPIVSRKLYNDGFRPIWPNSKKFAVCISHDIDFLYKTNSFKGSIKKFVKRPSLQGITEIGTRRAPYRNISIERLVDYFLKREIRTSFYLLALNKEAVDFNYTLEEIQESLDLLLSNQFEIGLHGGLYTAFNSIERLREERCYLEKFTHQKTIGFRSQWLKFRFPDTFKNLVEDGFLYDSSIAYPDMPGFRNGMCYPFRLVFPGESVFSKLLELPLNFMDVTGSSYLGLGAEDYLRLGKQILNTTEDFGGVFTILWHNNNFEGNLYPVFDELVSTAIRKDAWFAPASEITRWWVENNLELQEKMLKKLFIK
jgi:hypothetical protein